MLSMKLFRRHEELKSMHLSSETHVNCLYYFEKSTGRWFIKGNATIAIDKCHIFPCILHITPGRMQPSLLTNAAFSQEASECALQKQLRL